MPPPRNATGTSSHTSDSQQSPDGHFERTLATKLRSIQESQSEAQARMRSFAAGRTDRAHEVSIAVEKARLQLKMASLIRGKLLDAYKELMTLR